MTVFMGPVNSPLKLGFCGSSGQSLRREKSHVITLLNSSHASLGPHRVPVWGNGIVQLWRSKHTPCWDLLWKHPPLKKRRKYGIPLPEKGKLHSHVPVPPPPFTLSHHLHQLLLITSSSWFLKCDIYNRKAVLVFGLFPSDLIMFVLPHLSGGHPYVDGVNPQMGLCSQWKAINHDACPRFWKFPALPANLKITLENWLSVALLVTSVICVISILYCHARYCC